MEGVWATGSAHPGELDAEAAGQLPHLLRQHALRRADTLVHRRHDEVLEHVPIGLLEQRGLDAELYHLELAAHHGGHHAAARARLDRALGQLLLDVRYLLLQLLRLPEEPAQVEALAHHALPAPIPHAAHLGAEDLDRGLFSRAAPPPGAAGFPAPKASRRWRMSSSGRSGGRVASRTTHISRTSFGSTLRAGAASASSASRRRRKKRCRSSAERRPACAASAATSASGSSATSARSPVAASTARWRKCSRRSRQKRCAS